MEKYLDDSFTTADLRVYVCNQRFNNNCFTVGDLDLILDCINKCEQFANYYRRRASFHDMRNQNQLFTMRLLARAKLLKQFDFKIDFELPEYQNQL